MQLWCVSNGVRVRDKKRTKTRRILALRLFQKAVDFAHLVEGSFLPAAILSQDRDHLLPQWLKVLAVKAHVIQGVSSRHGSSMDGSQAQQQLAVCKLCWQTFARVGGIH